MAFPPLSNIFGANEYRSLNWLDWLDWLKTNPKEPNVSKENEQGHNVNFILTIFPELNNRRSPKLCWEYYFGWAPLLINMSGHPRLKHPSGKSYFFLVVRTWFRLMFLTRWLWCWLIQSAANHAAHGCTQFFLFTPGHSRSHSAHCCFFSSTQFVWSFWSLVLVFVLNASASFGFAGHYLGVTTFSWI